MKVLTKNFKLFSARTLVTVVLLAAPVLMIWAQETNKKYALTTQMFLNELKEQSKQPVGTRRHTPARRFNGKLKSEQRLIASPDTVGGVVYISCFIHLKDAGNLSAVRALGVEVEETFDGLDFVTARVPVKELEALADIDNVTKIKVARRMRLLTDEARKKTNVDDLLTQSPDALALGVNSKYDGSGVILGVIDTGIDFRHIAFKDKNGNSRIKRAYVYKGSSGTEYTESNISSVTTDDSTEDHGTHTASTAGGSSVIVSGNNVTVTDDHANATYGGMAPGADLYLAGINGLNDTGLTNALKKMVSYADAQGKPLVVSNSWGSGWGPRDGTGEWATLVGQYFGDSHPNRVILFASSNDAGHKTGNEGGGFFVKKSSASSSNPLGTIIRTDGEGGYYYVGLMACAWATSKLNCKLHVLDASGTIKKTWTVTKDNTSTFSGLSTYYTGSMTVYIEQNNGKYMLAVYSEYGMENESEDEDYTLAIEVYPESGSANINMWSGDYTYFTDHLTTSGHTWTEGTDDMCVSDEATIPDAISIGAYVSKKNWKASNGSSYTSNAYTLGDIAYFSSYATAENSPTGLAYPWITAPGARLAAGVNHNHTASTDDYSYYGSTDLVVNNTNYPYAMMEGTSMATPVAAGIVALWLQASMDENAQRKNLTVNDVKEIMEATAINDTYTTTGANASHFGKGKIDALAGIQYILSTPKPATPTIIADPTTLTFSVGLNEEKSLSFDVLSEFLTNDITVTLTDDNHVFSIDKTTITKAESEDGATVTVSFRSATAGTYTGEVTLSSEGAEPVTISLKGSVSTSNPDTKNFKLVTSTDNLKPGMRYIIACGSEEKAAGSLSSQIMSSKDVTVNSSMITITDDVAVFVLDETSDGWTFQNESTNKYLYATDTKKLAYEDAGKAWTLSNGTDGVIMTYGNFGTMLYNANNPRFTTYTSDPNTSMIQANLYMETNTEPKKDVTMAFDPTTAEGTIGKAFTEPTLTTDPADLTVTYESSEPTVATVDENTGEVTLVAAGETTITATFAGNESYNPGSASYTLTVKAPPVVGSYELVTDASTLAAGDKILIAYINGDDKYVLSTTQNANNRAATDDVILNADGTLTPGEAAQIITLEKDDDKYLFNVGDGYLYAASSSSNNMKTKTEADANAKATISISSNNATIKFQGNNTRNTIRFNPNTQFSSPLFSCYASNSTTGSLPQIYREIPLSFIVGDANGDGKVTITDAVAIVNYILGNPSGNFNVEAANVNNDYDDDGKPNITITDAVGVVNIILNSGASAPALEAPNSESQETMMPE